MFFFYVLYQKMETYDNSMQRNVSKLFLLDDTEMLGQDSS